MMFIILVELFVLSNLSNLFNNVFQSRFTALSFSMDTISSDGNLYLPVIDIIYVFISLCFEKLRSPDAIVTDIVKEQNPEYDPHI